MISYDEARDEMYAFFRTHFNLVAAGIVGYVPQVVYRNNEPTGKPPSDKFWLRVSIQTVQAPQTAFGENCGSIGKRRYTESGLFFIQLFAPKSLNGSDEVLSKFAKALRDGYRGKTTTNGIWFRNARVNELTPEELFYRSNVVTEFEYDDSN